jgi:hypothetical protein
LIPFSCKLTISGCQLSWGYVKGPYGDRNHALSLFEDVYKHILAASYMLPAKACARHSYAGGMMQVWATKKYLRCNRKAFSILNGIAGGL